MALSWKHVVPWRNRSEFVQTYRDLYSENVESQQNALAVISLWKSRAGNKLSVAIESSAALTEACLKYRMVAEARELRDKDFELRSALALALIRFVNHVTEKGQNKQFAQPVKKIAEEFGIPDWIVHVRHEGTHGSIPCLEVLIKGAQWSLTYLKDVFWSQQVKEAENRKRKRPKNLYKLSEIHLLLRRYQRASHKSVEEGSDSEAAGEQSRALRRLEHLLNGLQRNQLLRCLMESNHLITQEEQLKIYDVNLEETMQSDPPKVPRIVINVWKELLRMVQDKSLTALLLQHMLKALIGEVDTSSHRCTMLAAWLRLILLYHSSNYTESADERTSQPELYSSAIDFSKILLLSTCQQFPTVWTCSLLPLMGDSATMAAVVGSTVEVCEGDSTTAPDSGEGTGSGEGEEAKTKGTSAGATSKSTNGQTHVGGSVWKLCTEPVDWERLPIGVLPKDDCFAGTGCMYEYEAQSSDSASSEDSQSSEDEPDSTTQTHSAKDNEEERPAKRTKEDLIKDIWVP